MRLADIFFIAIYSVAESHQGYNSVVENIVHLYANAIHTNHSVNHLAPVIYYLPPLFINATGTEVACSIASISLKHSQLSLLFPVTLLWSLI